MLFQQNHRASQVDKGLKAAEQFVVPCCHPAKVLQFVKKALDQMTLLVLPPIAFPRIQGVLFRRYDVGGSVLGDVISDFL